MGYAATVPTILPAPHRDRGLKFVALGLAVLFHAGAMFITIPQRPVEPTQARQQTVLRVRHYIPPPPQLERRDVPRGPRRKTHRMIPVPDPTPDALEPVTEPEPEFYGDPLGTGEPELFLGDPQAPPGVGAQFAPPAVAGVGGVTLPVLIESTHVRPGYPEVARRARVEGRVILRGVVHPDGSVGELETLRCTQPYLGFEESAIQAVRQWRYEPATLDGEPLAVFFTIVVEFEIN